MESISAASTPLGRTSPTFAPLARNWSSSWMAVSTSTRKNTTPSARLSSPPKAARGLTVLTGEEDTDTWSLAHRMGAKIYKRYRFYKKEV